MYSYLSSDTTVHRNIEGDENEKRKYLYGETGEGMTASRMIHNGRYKFIYNPVGNYKQIFDLQKDPKETTNLAGLPVKGNEGLSGYARFGVALLSTVFPFLNSPEYSVSFCKSKNDFIQF